MRIVLPQFYGLIISMISFKFSNGTNNAAQITTINQPLPTKNPISDPSTFYAAFLVGPAFTFSCVGLVMEVVNDREVPNLFHR